MVGFGQKLYSKNFPLFPIPNSHSQTSRKYCQCDGQTPHYQYDGGRKGRSTTNLCSQHTAHCTLATAHCKLYTAHCTLQTKHCTMHSALYYTRQLWIHQMVPDQ